MNELVMLTCDHWQGKSWAGGIEPTRGKTRQDLLDEIRDKKKIFEICRHCGRRENLRTEPLVPKQKALLYIPPVPPEAHAFQLNPRRSFERRG